MKITIISLLFISAVYIGYQLDTHESSEMYKKLYIQSYTENKELNKSYDLVGSQKDSLLVELNKSNSNMDCYQDSIKSFKKYKKLYNQSLIKDTIR